MPKRVALQKLVVLFVSLAILGMAASGQQGPAKPNIQVVFLVQAIRYKGHFSADLPAMEEQAAKRFAKTLGERFAFLNFTTNPEPTKLTITLANLSSSATCGLDDAVCPKETILRMVLEQSNAPVASYDRWVYLSRQEFFVALGGVNEEVENLDRVGFGKLNVPDVMGYIFSRVQLAAVGHLIWRPSGGAGSPKPVLAGMTVPLPATLLCADQHSVLVMRSEFPRDFTTSAKAELPVDAQGPFVPPDNSSDDTWQKERGNLFGTPAEDPPHDRKWDAWTPLSSVNDRDQIKITGVFMYQYRRMDTGCGAAIPPTALTGASGGQP